MGEDASGSAPHDQTPTKHTHRRLPVSFDAPSGTRQKRPRKPPLAITPPTDSDRDTLRRIFNAGPDPEKHVRKEERENRAKEQNAAQG
jgi:hypothetical protein